MTPSDHVAGPPYDWTLPAPSGWAWTLGGGHAPGAERSEDGPWLRAIDDELFRLQPPCFDCGQTDSPGAVTCKTCRRVVCDDCWNQLHHFDDGPCRLPPG